MPRHYRNTAASREQEIDALWVRSRTNSRLPKELTPSELRVLVPAVVSVLRSRSRASTSPQRVRALLAA